jgi:hypothetical protein
MSKMYDRTTETGVHLDDAYDRLVAVDYDPNCPMVDVINEYDDLPRIEKELEARYDALQDALVEYQNDKDTFNDRRDKMIDALATAEIWELTNE